VKGDRILVIFFIRAKKLAIIVGESKAIALAVRQVSDRQRYTYLAKRLAKFTDTQI
jgi:exodeoxyribonuclease V alpha subunit